jgi:hypothetical protein
MGKCSEVFAAFDVAKKKHAVAIAEGARSASVRFWRNFARIAVHREGQRRVNLTRSPSLRRRTDVCAQRPAGFNVDRSLLIVAKRLHRDGLGGERQRRPYGGKRRGPAHAAVSIGRWRRDSDHSRSRTRQPRPERRSRDDRRRQSATLAAFETRQRLRPRTRAQAARSQDRIREQS